MDYHSQNELTAINVYPLLEIFQYWIDNFYQHCECMAPQIKDRLLPVHDFNNSSFQR